MLMIDNAAQGDAPQTITMMSLSLKWKKSGNRLQTNQRLIPMRHNKLASTVALGPTPGNGQIPLATIHMLNPL